MILENRVWVVFINNMLQMSVILPNDLNLIYPLLELKRICNLPSVDLLERLYKYLGLVYFPSPIINCLPRYFYGVLTPDLMTCLICSLLVYNQVVVAKQTYILPCFGESIKVCLWFYFPCATIPMLYVVN